ncbi:hypothetical protein NFI96_008306 [Prochilodus magdalenae]|nr:hypothetical protein NFI96_008306 [Prochilodus magdalenae]
MHTVTMTVLNTVNFAKDRNGVIPDCHGVTQNAWARVEVSMEDKVEVFMDSKAEITCMYTLDEPSSELMIQWFARSSGSSRVQIYYKDNSLEFEENGTGYTGRIDVSHSLETTKGNSVLTINGTQITDEQEFLCQVSVDGDSKEGRTQLYVFPVKVTTSKTVNPSRLLTVESKLHLLVEKPDKDAKFYCEVVYTIPGRQEMMESDRVNIILYYPTTNVTMNQKSPEGLVKEGDTVEITCEGNGNPQPLITFMYNEDEIGSENGLLVLDAVTRANSGQYLCHVLDQSFEEFFVDLNLTVHFLDSVVITPEEPVYLEEGQDLSLTCNALSSLSTQATWYKDGAFFAEGHILELHKVSSDMTGMYVCEVKASDLPGLQRDNSVFITVMVKPVIQGDIKVIPLDNKKTANLSCIASGYPLPNISWTLFDEQAHLGEWTIPKEDEVHSFIAISATSGNITATCKATNMVGSDEVSQSIDLSKFQFSHDPVGIYKKNNYYNYKYYFFHQYKGAPIDKVCTTVAISWFYSLVSFVTDYRLLSAPELQRLVLRHSKGCFIQLVKNFLPKPERLPVACEAEGSGVIIAVIIILILLLAILGSVLYYLYKRGKIPCGRSGKQDLTKEKASKDDVLEIKSGKSEEAVLLQGVNGDKKIPNEQTDFDHSGPAGERTGAGAGLCCTQERQTVRTRACRREAPWR